MYTTVRHLVECLNSGVYTSASSGHFLLDFDSSKYLGQTFSAAAKAKGFQWGHDVSEEASNIQDLKQIPSYSMQMLSSYKSSSTSQGAELTGFIDTLQKLTAVVTRMNINITELLAVVDLLGEIVDPQNAYVFESLDGPGRRYSIPII